MKADRFNEDFKAIEKLEKQIKDNFAEKKALVAKG
jgi:hypothetical protein